MTGQRNYVDSSAKKQGGKGKRRAIVAVVAVAVIAAVVGLSFVLLGRGCSTGGIEVPDLAGKTLDEARSQIEEAGFELGTIEYQNSDSVESGKVISQTPRAGTHQEAKTKVTLVVSQGAEQANVPDLSNMTANEARAALQAAGLKYEAGTAEYSDTVAEGRVVRQNPAAGQQVDKGSTITYYLSAGEEKVSVPNVVGQLEGTATTTLSNAGFTVSVDYQPSSSVSEGYVISQTPKSGEKAKSKSAVSIVVSTGASVYNVSAYVIGAAGGGYVSPEYTTVDEGGSVSFYITTNAGYEIASVTDSNGKSYGASSSVTISNVRGDVSLAVEFAESYPSSSSSSTVDPTPSSSSSSSKKKSA